MAAFRLPLASLALTGLGACATIGEAQQNTTAGASDPASHASRPIDRQARQRIVRSDLLTQMAFWAGEYQTFPNDLEAAQRFSDALRRGGRADRAAEIAGEALGRFPDDKELTLTYGLAQLSAGRPQEALRPLAIAAEGDAQNWRARSALGAALDQIGRFQQARLAYDEALAIVPDNARVLTNLGVSHLMTGEAAEAEAVLRRALAQPDAPPEARQNLAVSIAPQGRFDEAEQIERLELPPAEAAANMTYLRGLLSDQRRWDDLGRPG